MSNKLTGLISFIFGAAIGSLVSWQVLKNKYDQLIQEEVDSVKEVFSKRDLKIVKESEPMTDDSKSVREKAEKAKEKPNVMEYAKKLKEEKYTTNYSAVSASVTEEDEDVVDQFDNSDEFSEFDNIDDEEEPSVITPDEFGMCAGYGHDSLTLYADRVLADDSDEVIEDVKNVVGSDFFDRFGEYEDDVVYVRNDKLRCDYEIFMDNRKYSDVVKDAPDPVEVE